MSSTNTIRSGIFKGSLVLAVFMLVSRLMGLLRDRVLASQFGASETLDVYYAAFKVPDFIFNLIIIGAVSSAFIPVFIQYRERAKGALSTGGRGIEDSEGVRTKSSDIGAVGDSTESEAKDDSWRLASNFLNSSLLLVVVASVVLILFVPYLVPLIAPGFGPLQRADLVDLTRLMFLSPIIFAISTVLGSVLQSVKRFLAFAIAPSFYNLGIIIGAIYFEPHLGLMGLGWGVVLGAGLHLLIQAPAAWRAGFRWQKVLDFTSAGLRKIFKLMIPRTLGLAAAQINIIVITAIASTIAVGSISIFNFANNLQYLPISMIGVAISVAVFPSLSQSSARKNLDEFLSNYSSAFRQIVFLGVPSAFALFIFREPITNLVLGAGKFGIQDVSLTAGVLGIMAFGVLAISLVSLVNRAFFALYNTIIPVTVSVIAVATNVALSFLFVWMFKFENFSNFLQNTFGISNGPSTKILGLALAMSVAHVLYIIVLTHWFGKFSKGWRKHELAKSFGKALASSAIAASIIFVITPFLHQFSFSSVFLTQFVVLLVDFIVFGILFVAFAKIMKMKEVNHVLSFFRYEKS